MWGLILISIWTIGRQHIVLPLRYGFSFYHVGPAPGPSAQGSKVVHASYIVCHRRMRHESYSIDILIAAVAYNVKTINPLLDYVKTHNEPREIDLLLQKYVQSSEQNAPPAYIIEGNFFNHYGYFSSIQNRIRSETALDYLM